MIKKIFYGLFGVLAVLAVSVWWILTPGEYEPYLALDDVAITDFKTAPSGDVWFSGFHAGSGKDLMTGGNGLVHEPVLGHLYMPQGASTESPVPAVVILHGSGGDYTGRNGNLARKLAAIGIAGFAVDTFASRGLGESDGYQERLTKAGIHTQIADAFNALKALADHPHIDNSRIGVAGFSLGATASMFAGYEQIAGASMAGSKHPNVRFGAHLPLYTGCGFGFKDNRLTGAPWLIMIGAEDELSRQDQCEALVDRLKAGGAVADLKVYEGAAHGWDQPYPKAFKPDAFVTVDCFTEWQKDGEVIETTSGYSMDHPLTLLLAFSQCASTGYTMGRWDSANIQSVQDIAAFLDKNWGGTWSAALTDEILSIGIPD